MSNKLSGIYIIKNIITGDIYIGSTSNLIKRKSTHFRSLIKNKHHSVKLQRSYNKYGKENFEFNVICNCEINLLLHLEQIYINTMKPYFNSAISSISPMKGRKHSKETIEKFKVRNVS